MNRTKLQDLCREADLPGWAESHEHLCGLEKVLAVLGEPTTRMEAAGGFSPLPRELRDKAGRLCPGSVGARSIWKVMWSARFGDGG
jgi:hypothetical protein